jgi:anti-sigma-K factor RskA
VSRDAHEDIRGLLAPYALGALEPGEREAVRAHLLDCEECLGDADNLAAAAASLSLAVVPRALPQGFSDRLEARIAADRPDSERAVAPPRRWSLGWLAAAVLVVALAVVASALVDARRDEARRQEALAAVLRDDGMRLEGPAGAVGRMVATDDGGVLAVAGLPPAPAGRVYQLWLIADHCDPGPCDPVPGGTFDTDDGVAVHETRRSLADVGGVAVTTEPEGGSDRPTTEPVISSL